MIGTYQPNFFHRLGNAWNAFKGIEPGLLYPPARQSSTHWISWQGWSEFEKQAQSDAERDRRRAETATTSPWVFADVQAIANEFSTAELVIKERRGTKLEDVENHPMEQLWESPNEHMGRSFVTSFWAWSYVLASKAYLYWVPDNAGGIAEVWPVPPFMIRPIPDRRDFIGGYVFKSSPQSEPLYIASEFITFSHSVNLFDARDGLSFLAAAMTEIDADLSASLWNKNFFDENNGLPDGMIGLSKDALDTDVDRARLEIRDFFGGVKRGIAVARTGDLSYTQFGRSQKDMEFGQGREFASKVIGRTLGFPDGYWSDLANRANAEQARKTMISGAVWPLLVRLAEDMNAKNRGVVQRWYGPQYRVEFKDIRPEDRQLFLQEIATRKEYWLINELREADGKDPLEDVRGLMLVAEINKGAPTPGSEPAQELDDMQAEKDAQAAEEQAQQQAALIESGQEIAPGEEQAPPPEAASVPAEGERPMPEEQVPPMKALTDVRTLDLKLWEAKALHDLKRKGRVYRAFESDAIDPETHARISAALKAAQSVDEVRAAFKAGDDKGVVDRIVAAGGKRSDEIRVWRHKKTGKWAVSIGDWASKETTAAIHKVLGTDVEIDAEWVPGEGYEAIKASDALDALLDDVDDDARAWAGEAVGE